MPLASNYSDLPLSVSGRAKRAVRYAAVMRRSLISCICYATSSAGGGLIRAKAGPTKC
jgi:hypothetical protein